MAKRLKIAIYSSEASSREYFEHRGLSEIYEIGDLVVEGQKFVPKFTEADLADAYKDDDDELIDEIEEYLEAVKGRVEPPFTRNNILNRECDFLIFGKKAYEGLKSHYHWGVRKENYGDLCQSSKTGLASGANCLITAFPSERLFDTFMKPSWGNPLVPNDPVSSRIMYTFAEAMNVINILYDYKNELSLDYETTGMPDKAGFKILLASFCTQELHSVGLDFEAIEEEIGTERMKSEFYPAFGNLLFKLQHQIWTANMSYEVLVSYYVFHLWMEFNDVFAYNYIEGFNFKRFSLKYSAQRILRINSWDDDFDYLTDTLEKLFAECPNRTFIDEETRDEEHWSNHDIWSAIAAKYPNDQENIFKLVEKNYGNPYHCIPGNILGTYCNKDVYMTMQIRNKLRDVYSVQCVEVFMASMRFSAQLQAVGMFQDTKARNKFMDMSERLLMWSLITIYDYTTQRDFENISSEGLCTPEDYTLDIQNLMKYGCEIHSDHLQTVKHAVLSCKNEEYENLLDTNRLQLLFGDYAERCAAVLLNSGGLGNNLERKKSVWDIVRRETPTYDIHFGHDPAGNEERTAKHERTKRSISINKQRAWVKYLMDELPNIDTPLKETYLLDDGKTPCKVPDLILILMKNKMNIRSHEVYPVISRDIIDNEPNLALLPMIQQLMVYELDNTEEIIEECLDTYGEDELIEYIEGEGGTTGFDWREDKKLMSDIFSGIKSFGDVGVNVDWEYYKQSGFERNSSPMRAAKIVLACKVFKKYNKMYFTYLVKLFNTKQRYVEDFDEMFVSNPVDTGKGTISKTFPYFKVMETHSKRWSSGFHTLFGKSESKEIVTSPKGCLIHYADVSQAEPRTLAFFTKDKKMSSWYREGKDIYIEMARLFDPNIDKLDAKEFEEARGMYKQLMLALTYGMGNESLAGRLDKSVDEVGVIKSAFFENFPQVTRFIEERREYPTPWNPFINTILGDVIKLNKAEKNKWKRQGVNMCIQSFTALALIYGFENICREARKQGITFAPIGTVHDSAQNYFSVKDLMMISEFSYKHFTEFLWDKFKIMYKFDIFVGADYTNLGLLNQVSENSVMITGTATTILKILDKMIEEDIDFNIDVPYESLQRKEYPSLLHQIVSTGNAGFGYDLSKHKVTVTYI